MVKSKASIALILVVVLFFSVNLEAQSGNKKETESELNLITSFPSIDAQVLFSSPVNLTFSSDEIFISDWRQSTIFVFDHEGKYQRKIGQQGKGPREFNNQIHTKFNSNKLFVSDQGNRRVAIIDLAADTSRVYPQRDIFREFAVSNDRIFAFIPSAKHAKKDSSHLISMFDHSLDAMGSFGNYLNHVENMNQWASLPNLEMYGGNLYASFSSFPILKIYSTSGQLVETMELDNPNENYRDRIEQNYEPESYETGGEKSRKLFECFAINKDGLFFNLYDKNALIIDQFDHQGNFVKRYRQKISGEEFFVRDMEVTSEEDGTLRFYILNITDGYPKVDVYEAQGQGEQTASLP